MDISTRRRRFLFIILAIIIVLVVEMIFLRENSVLKSTVVSVRHAMIVSGRERQYFVYLPNGYPESQLSYPLVMVFHGGEMTSTKMEEITDFDAQADAKGFIVVYPEGVDKSWNDGRKTTAAAKQNVNDIEFIRALINQLKKDYSLDSQKIYATGASNGGMFTHYLGCEMSDVFSAIAPVIATMPSEIASTCAPTQPIGVLMIVGNEDAYIPFQGGQEGWQSGKGAGGLLESANATVKLWVEKNQCAAGPVISELPIRVQDGTTVVSEAYESCANNKRVQQYVIQGGGHNWPPHQPSRIIGTLLDLGKSSQNIDATEVITQFFLGN